MNKIKTKHKVIFFITAITLILGLNYLFNAKSPSEKNIQTNNQQRPKTMTEKCEIITNSTDPNHVIELKEDYPTCKIIQKSNSTTFNLINRLFEHFH